jgi:enamine deaminase RidA (YjgF/YER057c/UK114 family)
MPRATGRPEGSGVSTAEVGERLKARALALPRPWRVPAGVTSARLVRVAGDRVLASGHVPLGDDGEPVGPAGVVGADLDLAAAQQAALRAALGLLAGIDVALGDLSRIRGWCLLRGMVRAAPGFTDFPAVFNPVSQLLVGLFGEEIGARSRVAVGVAGLPWNMPAEIEAQLVRVPQAGR